MIAADRCEFDRILARRLRNEHVEYLVKWKDPNGGAATWEPVEHIHDPATVAAFERGPARAAAYAEWVRALCALASWYVVGIFISKTGFA